MHTNAHCFSLVYCLLSCSAVNAQDQLVKGLVDTTPSSITTPGAVVEKNEPVFDEIFHKDPFMVIRDDAESDQTEVEEKIFSIRKVWNILDSDVRPIPETELDRRKNILEVYYESFSEELHSDPFYHIGRDAGVDRFIYDEQAWDALADTLRRKYKAVRCVYHAAMRAERAVTLRYESKDNVVYKLRPGIERVGTKEFVILRFAVRGMAGTRIDTRAGENGFKFRLGKNADKLRLAKALSIEYEACRTEPELADEKWEQKSQVCVRVPVW